LTPDLSGRGTAHLHLSGHGDGSEKSIGVISAMAVKAEQNKGEGQDESLAARWARLKQFVVEVRQEFGKVVWPAKKQTIMSTTVVVALVILVAIYLGSIDLVLGKIVGAILR
jgi:preprotein translocase subunit SecE